MEVAPDTRSPGLSLAGSRVSPLRLQICDDVCSYERIGDAIKVHCGAGDDGAWIGDPGVNLGGRPNAAQRLQRGCISEALAVVPNSVAHHTEEIRTAKIQRPRANRMTGRTASECDRPSLGICYPCQC